MGTRLPVYYCPPTVPRPAHIRAEAPNQLLDGMGPDRLGGITYGDIWRPEQVWHQTSAGWWACLDGVTTRDLMRTAALAGLPVVDAQGRTWLVPRIIGLDGAPAVGYWTPTGFAVPADLALLVDELRAMSDAGPAGPVTAAMAALAARLIEVNYHATLHELGIWQAFTPNVVLSVVMAGYSMTMEQILRAMPEGIRLGPA